VVVVINASRRCRACGWRIPARYWFVELACALLFAVVALLLVT